MNYTQIAEMLEMEPDELADMFYEAARVDFIKVAELLEGGNYDDYEPDLSRAMRLIGLAEEFAAAYRRQYGEEPASAGGDPKDGL